MGERGGNERERGGRWASEADANPDVNRLPIFQLSLDENHLVEIVDFSHATKTTVECDVTTKTSRRENYSTSLYARKN